MPTSRTRLTQGTNMGQTIKCIATYDEAFWRTKGFSGEVVATQGPITVIFDNTSFDGKQPALLAFLVGQEGRRWSEQSDEHRKQMVLPTSSTSARERCTPLTMWKRTGPKKTGPWVAQPPVPPWACGPRAHTHCESPSDGFILPVQKPRQSGWALWKAHWNPASARPVKSYESFSSVCHATLCLRPGDFLQWYPKEFPGTEFLHENRSAKLRVFHSARYDIGVIVVTNRDVFDQLKSQVPAQLRDEAQRAPLIPGRSEQLSEEIKSSLSSSRQCPSETPTNHWILGQLGLVAYPSAA